MKARFILQPTVSFFVILLIGIITCACVKMDRQPLSRVYFNLETTRPVAGPTEPLPGVLEIRKASVSPRFSQKALVYKSSALEYKSDFYNLFFIPPADMITQELRKWLEQARLFKHITDPESLAQATCTMEGIVNDLYGDFSSETASAVVGMQFFVLDDESPDMKILFSQSYKKEIPLKAASATALINGFNQALSEIFSELESDIRTKF